MATDPLSFLDASPSEKSVSSDPLSFLDQPKGRKLKKGDRLAAQYAIGAAETAAIPYELAVAPLASKDAQHAEYRKNVFEDIERLLEQKQTGVWDQEDQQLYDNLVSQIRSPEKAEKFVKTGDIGIGALAEKGAKQFGVDLEPEGFSEHAARIGGNIVSPKNLLKMGKGAVNLATKEGRLASKWNSLAKAAKGNGQKEGLLKFAQNLDLSPEASSLLMQSRGKVEILGKVAKKTKKYKAAVGELHEKLGANYEKLKEIGRSGGYIGSEASESLSNNLSKMVGDLERTLIEGPDTKAAKEALNKALNKLEMEGATVEDLISSRINLGQSINWKNVDPKGTMLNRGRKVLLDSIEKANPSVAKEVEFTDRAWAKYSAYAKNIKKPHTIMVAGHSVPIDNVLFAVAIKGLTAATWAKAGLAVGAKEIVQRLSTQMLINPKLQGIHKRLINAVLEGSKDKQAALIITMKKILKKEDPELYSELESSP